jgi:hypothetical protein
MSRRSPADLQPGHDRLERILKPAEVPVTMTEAVFEVCSALGDHPKQVGYDASRILRMDMCG